MEGIGWIAFLFIGLIAGWVAEKVMHRSHGLLTNLVVGVVGAYLGALLFSAFGLADGGFWWSLLVAIIGAILLLWIVSLIRGRTAG